MGWGFTHCFGDGSELGVTPCECPHSPDRHRGCSELRVLTALQTSEQTSCACLDGADDNSLKLQQKKKKKKRIQIGVYKRTANRCSRLPGAVPGSPAQSLGGVAARKQGAPSTPSRGTTALRGRAVGAGRRCSPPSHHSLRSAPSARGAAVCHMCWAGLTGHRDLEVLKIILEK